MPEKSHEIAADHQRRSRLTSAPRFTQWVGALLPATLVMALMAGLIGGRPGAYMAFAVALVAPGWLIWRLLPHDVLDWNHPLALPAVWFVLSFTVLSPAVAGLVFFGLNAAVVEWHLVVTLLILGVAAARRGPRTVGSWDPITPWIVAAMGAGFAYRSAIWHVGTDDHTYIGYLRAFVATGDYPTTNPFMYGDIPLAPRWRLDSWTGLTGVLAQLGDLDVEVFFREILPGLLVIIAASALFLLALVLSGSRPFAQVAALAGLVVPLITDSAQYRSIEYNKATALLVFLPVVAALMICVYRTGRRGSTVLAAAAFWGSMFVHPLPALLTAGAVAGFVAVKSFVTREVAWRRAALVGAAMVPMIVTALVVSTTSERFGVRLGEVEELSEIAEPAIDFGPISIWKPLKQANILDYDSDSAAAVVVRGHVNGTAGPRLLFLENGLPLAHWRVLIRPSSLAVALALLIIVFGRHRDDTAIWILGTTLAALSVFVLPPLAALIGRFVTPWQLWRFLWLLPVTLAPAWIVGVWLPRTRWRVPGIVAVIVAIAVATSWASPRFFFRTEPGRAYERLHAEIGQLRPYEGIFLAESPHASQAGSQLETFEAVAAGGFTHLSNGFPSLRRAEAFNRMRDRKLFYSSEATTAERLEILGKYEVDHVLVKKADTGNFDFDALGLDFVESIGSRVGLYVPMQPADQ
jgi:hypothetical protein